MLQAYFLTLKQFRAGFEKKKTNAQLLLMLLVAQHYKKINSLHQVTKFEKSNPS